MGKRSSFKRVERDFYPTPIGAVVPLIEHLPDWFRYVEPCAGDGKLIRNLQELKPSSVCVHASDIKEDEGIEYQDALMFEWDGYKNNIMCITNPPWDRKILHPLIETLVTSGVTWLLFDADWMHTKQAKPYLIYCSKIVSIGRVSWFGDGVSGKDNCAWYCFDIRHEFIKPTAFYGRQ